jgi:hypothetical protein
MIGPYFIDQSDSAAFLLQVDEESRFVFTDILEGLFQLISAVAPERTEYIPGVALGMYPDRASFRSGKITAHKGGVFLVFLFVVKTVNRKDSRPGGEFSTASQFDNFKFFRDSRILIPSGAALIFQRKADTGRFILLFHISLIYLLS